MSPNSYSSLPSPTFSSLPHRRPRYRKHHYTAQKPSIISPTSLLQIQIPQTSLVTIRSFPTPQGSTFTLMTAVITPLPPLPPTDPLPPTPRHSSDTDGESRRRVTARITDLNNRNEGSRLEERRKLRRVGKIPRPISIYKPNSTFFSNFRAANGLPTPPGSGSPMSSVFNTVIRSPIGVRMGGEDNYFESEDDDEEVVEADELLDYESEEEEEDENVEVDEILPESDDDGDDDEVKDQKEETENEEDEDEEFFTPMSEFPPTPPFTGLGKFQDQKEVATPDAEPEITASTDLIGPSNPTPRSTPPRTPPATETSVTIIHNPPPVPPLPRLPELALIPPTPLEVATDPMEITRMIAITTIDELDRFEQIDSSDPIQRSEDTGNSEDTVGEIPTRPPMPTDNSFRQSKLHPFWAPRRPSYLSRSSRRGMRRSIIFEEIEGVQEAEEGTRKRFMKKRYRVEFVGLGGCWRVFVGGAPRGKKDGRRLRRDNSRASSRSKRSSVNF